MSLEPNIRSSEVELGPRLPERATNERRVFPRLKMLYGVDSPSGMNLVHYKASPPRRRRRIRRRRGVQGGLNRRWRRRGRRSGFSWSLGQGMDPCVRWATSADTGPFSGPGLGVAVSLDAGDVLDRVAVAGVCVVGCSCS